MAYTSTRKLRNWDTMPQILTLTDATIVIGLDRHTLAKLARNGDIPGAKKLGSKWCFERDMLRAYFAENGKEKE